MKPSIRRCAIYTRKSTEDGLEQDFNSLDAQWEACHSYILSQKAEGWTAIKDHYDDGGFTGGNMDRPALKQLMDDIRLGKVHIVVVYKIDRLTRSLMDFARLVEAFDKQGVTFVSVTQSFNTTTSMGRLTLNVLLSFAQFEREVTSERIRDKFAASRKKGMWMGGSVPLGYEVKDRVLIPHEKNAETVRNIYQAYLRSEGLLHLKDYLEQAGYRTQKGHVFSRGGLYLMLTNLVYVGKVTYKKKHIYDGLHKSIVPQDLWDAVQKKLTVNPGQRGQKKVCQDFLLKGLIYDENDVLYTPVFTSRGKQIYRYYVSRDKFEGKEDENSPSRRYPAQEIEDLIEKALRRNLEDPEKLAGILDIDHALNYDALKSLSQQCAAAAISAIIKKVVQRIVIGNEIITMEIKPEALLSFQQEGSVKLDVQSDIYKLEAPFQIGKDLKYTVVIRPPATNTPEDIFSLPPKKLVNLMKGIIWRDEHFRGMSIRGIARRENYNSAYVGHLIRESLEIA